MCWDRFQLLGFLPFSKWNNLLRVSTQFNSPQLQLYLFTFNLQLHDSFHPRIGEPNRGGGRDTNLKKEKKKRTILKTVPAVIVLFLQIFKHKIESFSNSQPRAYS